MKQLQHHSRNTKCCFLYNEGEMHRVWKCKKERLARRRCNNGEFGHERKPLTVDVLKSMCFQSSDYLLSCVTDSFTRSASFCCFNRSFMSPPVCRFISTCGSRSESSDLASARPALPVHGDPQLGRSVSQHNPGPPPHVVCVL